MYAPGRLTIDLIHHMFNNYTYNDYVTDDNVMMMMMMTESVHPAFIIFIILQLNYINVAESTFGFNRSMFVKLNCHSYSRTVI